MTKLITTIHNIETGQIIERPINDAELAQIQLDKENAQAREREQAAKAAEKAALLAKLGISESEAKLLLS